MLDDRVRAVLERLEREDAEERERGLPPENEFMSLSRTLTLNTSDEAQTVTEIYVAQIERRRG